MLGSTGAPVLKEKTEAYKITNKASEYAGRKTIKNPCFLVFVEEASQTKRTRVQPCAISGKYRS